MDKQRTTGRQLITLSAIRVLMEKRVDSRQRAVSDRRQLSLCERSPFVRNPRAGSSVCSASRKSIFFVDVYNRGYVKYIQAIFNNVMPTLRETFSTSRIVNVMISRLVLLAGR